MKNVKFLLIFFFCMLLNLFPTTVHAQELESDYIFSDFCCYWSYGYQEQHIYSSYYFMNGTTAWKPIDTDLKDTTGKVLVIGDEGDEEFSGISYAIANNWDFYKNIIYTGEYIPTENSFNYVSSEEVMEQDVSGYDLIIIELAVKDDAISESFFVKLSQMVLDEQYIVYDRKITNCVYTDETDGSVAIIDCDNNSLLISSNAVPGLFVTLREQGVSGKSITLSAIANPANSSTAAYRGTVLSVKILPTYNSNILTPTFYTWYDASEVILPSCIDTISDNCFKDYSSLELINLDHIKTIGDSAFQNCNFSEIIIPNCMQEIGVNSFYGNNIDLLEIHVNKDEVSLGANSFFLNEDAALHFIYDDEHSGKQQLFSPFVENDMDITVENFSSLITDGFILSFVGITESSGEAGVYTVTFVDDRNPVRRYQKQVKNGNRWAMYLENPSNRDYSNVILFFIGWSYEDGTIIGEKDIVNIDRNITIYSLYERENDTELYNVNFPEYNKTIDIHYGDTLSEYDIPTPQQDDDTFVGWTQYRPVKNLETENILTERSRWWITSDDTINLYAVWSSELDKLTTTETLSMVPNYYLNANNTGAIYYYENGEMTLKRSMNQTTFSNADSKNAEALLDKIITESRSASKICIVPTDFDLNITTAKENGYSIIESNLNNTELKQALTFMNCKYFQYLLVVQTPYLEDEDELNQSTGVGYEMRVNDWEIIDSDTFEGWVYGIDAKIFMQYYNICNRVNTLTDALVKDVFKFNTSTTITDALKDINDYSIQFTAYDDLLKIYDLKWFLEKTSESRNLDKKADHHGVCASYSKLAYAVLGKCGYETIPCATWESPESYKKNMDGDTSNGPVHSINKVAIGGKDYYCDFTWASEQNPMQYMFLTLEEVNNISSHYNPVPDNYGTIIKLEGIGSASDEDENVAGSEKMVTITFYANGGSPDKKVKVQEKNREIENIPTISRSGYIFKGWYTEKTGGKKVTKETKPTSDMTLYAHWSKVTVKKSTIKSAKNVSKNSITIKFKKLAKVEGYQIQCSTSRTFTKKTTSNVNIKGNKTFKKKLKKLKKNTYYIRVRAYKTDSTLSKVYGKWSAIKKVNMK